MTDVILKEQFNDIDDYIVSTDEVLYRGYILMFQSDIKQPVVLVKRKFLKNAYIVKFSIDRGRVCSQTVLIVE